VEEDMLRIRRDTIEDLRNESDRRLIGRIARHLREMHPDRVKDCPEDVLFGRIRYALSRGRSYGFKLDYSLTTFASLMFAVAPDFDREPAIQEILSDERIPETYRFDVLVEQTSEEHWASAVRNTDPRAWDIEP
jgi:hypothetical protein